MVHTNNDVTGATPLLTKCVMAFLLRLGALVPTAIRVAVPGGAVYGSAKYEVWADSKESREKLDRLRNSVEREIEYPQMTGKYQKVQKCLMDALHGASCIHASDGYSKCKAMIIFSSS